MSQLRGSVRTAFDPTVPAEQPQGPGLHPVKGPSITVRRLTLWSAAPRAGLNFAVTEPEPRVVSATDALMFDTSDASFNSKCKFDFLRFWWGDLRVCNRENGIALQTYLVLEIFIVVHCKRKFNETNHRIFRLIKKKLNCLVTT